MLKKIQIVTDSTADLPREFIDANNITVVPLYVNFPDKSYRDGVDLTAKEFYPLLAQCTKELPKTSTPTIEDFTTTYRSLLEKGYEIISIHISSGLSSTCAMAEAAAKTLEGKIRVFDSRSISMGIGLQVTEALEMIKSNLSLDAIMEQLNSLRSKTEVYFSLDTLEYLEKGGRIGKVSALLGAILNIKPVVKVENGIYVPLDKARNQSQAIKKMVEHTLKTLRGRLPKNVAVVHGAAEEGAQMLKHCLEEALGKKVMLVNETGPVIGVHTGPGTLGLTFNY